MYIIFTLKLMDLIIFTTLRYITSKLLSRWQSFVSNFIFNIVIDQVPFSWSILILRNSHIQQKVYAYVEITQGTN